MTRPTIEELEAMLKEYVNFHGASPTVLATLTELSRRAREAEKLEAAEESLRVAREVKQAEAEGHDFERARAEAAERERDENASRLAREIVRTQEAVQRYQEAERDLATAKEALEANLADATRVERGQPFRLPSIRDRCIEALAVLRSLREKT